MIRKKIKRCFTLLELMVSMGVFAILMLALMQFFSSAQNIWTASNTKTELYENAKIAMNLIATDLMNLYYEHGKPGDSPKTFFLAGISNTSSSPSLKLPSSTETNFSGIAFCTLKPEPVTAPYTTGTSPKKGITRITEVFYLYDENTNKIYVKAVTDEDAKTQSGKKWCTEFNDAAGEEKETFLYYAMTDNRYWNELISNVTGCSFSLLNNQMELLKVAEEGPNHIKIQSSDDLSDDKARIPYAVSISLTVLNQETIEKMKAMTGEDTLHDIFAAYSTIKEEKYPDTGSETEKVLWQLYHTGKQDFTRVVTIDRGQYN